MKNKPTSPKGKILKHLQDGRVITPQIALSLYSHMRLASCIFRLRSEGFPIKTKMQRSIRGDNFAEYSMTVHN